ncbi:acid protease [Astrocystis sublimbata]|nr:acid protease [Astrocystis sublimbata]
MDCGIRIRAVLCIWTLIFIALSRGASNTIRSSNADEDQKAVVIAPSEYFEGNDGPWSTFFLRVGDPEQDVRVTVSTASPESFVVLSEFGCSDSVFEDVPDDCAVSRGMLFNQNDSSTWHELGQFGINQNGVGLEANLGYSQRSIFAQEKLGLGLTGPTLENQTVAGIATADPFYLGLFGLNNQPVNFTSLGNFSSPSFLTTLKDKGMIPSMSWSYTAGAKYRLKQVYGQLILSGYDTSRFEENSVSFSMADDITRDLVVVLQSISYSGSTSATLLSESIDIFVDSTDPNLWLPEDVCDAFEKAFDLTLDSDSGLYLVNDTHHNALLDSDAEVTFRLSDVQGGGDTVRITLPYAAFDLTAEAPLVGNTSHYFPLKRAANSTQYTLGRTFLQEAYLTADYERKVFNVSACVFNAGAEEDVVTILPKGSGESSTGGGGSSSGSGSKSLGGGAIAGIVIGAIVGALLLVAAIIFCVRRQRKKREYAASEPDPDMAVITGPVHNHQSTRTARTGKYFSPDTIGTSTEEGVSSNTTGTNGYSNGVSIGGESSQQELDGEATQVSQIAAPADDNGEGSRAQSIQQEEAKLKERETSPVYHELGGTGISKRGSEAVSSMSGLEPHVGREREEGADHLDSPFVSTLGSAGWQDKRGDQDLVSPTTPVRHSFA